MSNYAPGVTGNEPQIAGYAEREACAEVECDECHLLAVVLVTETLLFAGRYSNEVQQSWTCARCGELNVEEVSYDTEDPDAGRD